MSLSMRSAALFAATSFLALSSLIPSGCAKGGSSAQAGSGGAGGAGAGGDDTGLGLMLGSSSDPTTCDAAASARSYLGCDFWPTVTFNPVWSIFDFAVVVANTGAEPADIVIHGPAGYMVKTTVPPLDLATLTLPWDAVSKGPEFDTCTNFKPSKASVEAKGAAYHLTSSRPVIAYQFSALEYRGAGGPEGKDWSSCPGLQACASPNGSAPVGCFSFSNDASILLPSTAMTGNYRVPSLDAAAGGAFTTITATADGTSVSVHLGKKASVLAGGPVPAAGPGATIPLKLNAGDVIELAAAAGSDLGGTLIAADKPVQVLSGAACAAVPEDDKAGNTCDHLEESVQPAETLGKHYVLTPPTGALGAPAPYRVRLFGNVDGTQLTYPTGKPAGAPSTLAAGSVVDLGILKGDLEIVGDHELGVSTFLVSAALADPDDFNRHGDPSQSFAVAVEQFRKSYVFLAPTDYDVGFVDVLVPAGATVTLDGAPLPAEPTPVGASGFGVARVRLGAGHNGAHSLSSDIAVGVQVIGYGAYTSYQYPAGLELAQIAPPPIK